MNYGTMQARIAREVNRTDLAAEIRDAIQSAIQHYESTRFWFNEKSQSVSTSAGNPWVDVPADFVTADELTVQLNQRAYQLQRWSFADLDEIDTSGATVLGQPIGYALFGERFRIYPVPDAVYSITVAYLSRLGALSADSDTNAWMTDAEQLIRARAKWELALHRTMDETMVAAMERAEARALSVLQSRSARNLGAGYMRGWM